MAETTPAERVVELEMQIAELRASLPAHSIPPTMIMQLEELEEELEAARAELARIKTDQAESS
jgi:ribosomal protein L29